MDDTPKALVLARALTLQSARAGTIAAPASGGNVALRLNRIALIAATAFD